MGIASDLIVIVLAALVGAVLARLARQPLILGYIVAGVLVGPFTGPFTGGVTVKDTHSIEMLAEIGVALLLFSLGLEFSLRELKQLWRVTLLGTPIQLLLSGAVGFFLARALAMPWQEALWFGAIIGISSTMVVLKTLMARDALSSLSGKIMLGILIVQDLAIIPMLLILPEITSATPDLSAVGLAALKSVAFLLSMYFAGARLFPPLLSFIMRWGSREMFFVATLAIALGVAFLSYSLGLSFAFGAFVAGIVFSESDFMHQALSDVSRLRDLFSLVFFVSVGMLFNPSFFFSELAVILTVVATLMVAKAVITGGIVRALGYKRELPWVIGLGLSQVGEFAFVVANVGLKTNQLTSNTYSLLISATVLSMILTPGLITLAPRLYRETAPPPEEPSLPSAPLKQHVVILGGGVIGEYVANVLSRLDIPYQLVELDHYTVTELRKKGLNVVLGDATQRVILESIGTAEAQLLIIAVSDRSAVPAILSEVRELSPNLPIVLRSDEECERELVAQWGITDVVQPKLEAGLEMVRQSLLALERSESEVLSVLGSLRLNNYHLDGEAFPVHELRRLGLTRLLDFSWVELSPTSPCCNGTLLDLRLRDRYGISVVGLLRGGQFIPNPAASDTVEPGDILGVVGSRAQVKEFRRAAA